VHRVGVLTELPQVLRELGHDPRDVLAARAGIDPNLLRDPEGFMPFAEVGRVIEACLGATGCAHFGILVGRRGGTASLGFVGRLMRSAPTLGTALMDLCENQRRYVRGSVAYLLVQDGIAYLGYTLHVSMTAAEQMCEGALAIGASLLRELADVAPVAVQIARSAPRETAVYRELFGVAPQFDADQYALCFPASLLDRPTKNADRQLRAILERQLNGYRPLNTPGFSEQVTRVLHSRATLDGTSLPEIAKALGLHPRTLNRHLLNEGTSFRALREQALLQVARHLLAGTRLPVTQIALALGYGEPSSFTHAFVRMAGTTPAKWRAGSSQSRQHLQTR